MALRAVSPEKIEKRIKVLFYGMAGAGKTTASIQFPKVYLIDTEKGSSNSQYVKLLKDNGGVVFHTNDFDELLNEVKSLLTEEHEFKTLVIDPLTNLYNDLVDKSAIAIKEASKDKTVDGTEFGRHYSMANKKMKHLLNLLLRLDMNVIITSHSKNEYGKDMAVLGQTYDCYKKLDYLFDLVFEIQKRGKERVGIVKKTRVEGFPDGDNFPFSYAEIAKRYGKDVLERGTVPEVLATPEQVTKFKHLVNILKVEDATVNKWLTKASAETVEEFTTEKIQVCIDHLEKKINPETFHPIIDKNVLKNLNPIIQSSEVSGTDPEFYK